MMLRVHLGHEAEILQAVEDGIVKFKEAQKFSKQIAHHHLSRRRPSRKPTSISNPRRWGFFILSFGGGGHEPGSGKLNEIAVKVGRMEAVQEAQAHAIGKMADNVGRLVDKLDRSDDIAREADQRARLAHHRIDKLEKYHEDDIREMRSAKRWMIGVSS